MSRPDGLLERRRTSGAWARSARHRGGLNAQMFAEDVKLMVVPVGGRSITGRDVEVKCEPEDDDARQSVVLALAQHQRGHARDLTETVCDFVANTAWHLAAFGEQCFELVRGDQSGQALILPLPADGSVRAIGPFVIQRAPPTTETGHSRVVILWPRDSWHLTLPQEIGTRRTQDALLRRIEMGLALPEWLHQDALAGRPSVVDRETLIRAQYQEIFAATRRWGWPARFMGDAETTIYYQIHRRLTFQQTLAVLRGHILGELNAVLARLGLQARLSFANLPTPDEVSAVIGKLEQGAEPFLALSDAVR
jgi:hypothetical protein